ncbi:uncharacterized protein YecE (DUF72 family) [Mucilaginibacter oryzae]|uniref:Uncharacterized protein YecE (DUF72 family) n=1 Tax=Mucilaginibacter oryzae TaxID=468058 RepID=A0A316HDS7_9SPHI|nr:DUF72 domain-containing protein [Mucilaginibacter oryzae]PWK78718.1 uncharacterized protein YecE (DUF72 family) [Mucilaginibacter oryzae]
MRSEYYSGTSNVVLPVPNKLAFPEAYQHKSRLCYYGSLFNSVEINSTFYKLPLSKTVARWAEEVPAGFRFTFKMWKEITHNKGLAFKPADVQRFFEVINACTKKGCLLIQFPASIRFDSFRQLELLLDNIRRHDPLWQLHIAVEFRHMSWYNEQTYRMLQKFAVGMVTHDMKTSATPLMEPLADFAYLRFHGPEGGYRGSYADEVLAEYASYINEWLDEGKTVYTYFNNTLGDALTNLITLNNFVA